MTYANLVLARGVERFAADAVNAGASGLIVPDLPLEEAPATLAACDAVGLALVPLVAPTSTDERLRLIGARARGFLYTVSVTGTTGERAVLSDTFASVVARAKACTDVPVALGFGIADARAGGRCRGGGRRRGDRGQPPRAGCCAGRRAGRCRPRDRRGLHSGAALRSRRGVTARSTNLSRLMGLVLVATFSACLWIVLTAVGAKSFDAFLLALVIVLIAAATRMLGSALPSAQRED